ncbi:hypothetical protein HZB69_02720 [Candidatus Amesbacteria bacterium]|nr:hypothetical protein [Candidatus Amesbacteria bacterium]
MHAFLISNFQFSIFNSVDTLVITPEKSIGIDEVKRISSFLSKKPLGDKNRVYLKDAHLMTVPAQNAILKILEEPPGNSEIYLVTDQPDQLLPTILSRCQSLNTPNSQNTQITPINPSEFDLNTITTREQALAFLDGVEAYLHANLLSTINYEQIATCRKYLKANVNIKLCLDYLSADLLSY